MELKSSFDTFLQEIRPTKNQRDDLKTGHRTLRNRLTMDRKLAPIIVSDFLQGSYRRATAVRPNGDKRSDVDIIVVTSLHEDQYVPEAAIQEFVPFMEEHYKGKYRIQGRSIGVTLSYVELDLVVTSAPSEQELRILKAQAVTADDDLEAAHDWRLHPGWHALNDRVMKAAQVQLLEAAREAEWKAQPLRIPDRDAGKWEDTHPLEQIRWTRTKNASCAFHFVNVVKAIKWWRLVKYSEPKHPKGFPLERLVGECCPDGINSVAEGITRTLEAIVSTCANVAALGQKPWLADYGVPTHDVFKRISAADFAKFYDQVKAGAVIAREALDSRDQKESGELWRKLLGDKFPKPPENGGKKEGGFSPRESVTIATPGRFA